MTTIAVTILLSGLLIFLICLPLIYRKVPMNSTYGIRIAAAFKSEQRWYDINAYGGRCLAAWSWLVIAAGAAGFLVSPEHKEFYALGSAAVALLSVMIPVIQTVRWTRKHDA